MDRGNTRATWLFAAIALLTAAIFGLDLSLPIGMLGGALYVAPVLISLWLHRPRHTVYVALVATLLAVVVAFLTPSRDGAAILLQHRVVDLLVIWAATLFVLQRKNEEQRLRFLATALESAPDGIAVTDREGTVVWVNQAFTSLTGYLAESVVGHSARLEKSGEHDSAFYQNLWEVVTSGQVWRGEMVDRRQDGTLYAEQQTIAPVRNERGRATAYISIRRDISERRQTEEALQASEERFRTSVENMPDCFAIYSAIRDESGSIQDFRKEYVNAAACLSRNTTKQELIGTTLLESLPALRGPGLFEAYVQAVETGEPLALESVVSEEARGDREVSKTIDIRLTKLGDGFAAAWRDVTMRKRQEEALQASEERFRTSVENMLDCFGIYSAVRDESGSIQDFRTEYVNAAACLSNNATKQELIGKTLLEALPALRESGLFEAYVQTVETGEPCEMESVAYEDTGGVRGLSKTIDIRLTKLGDGFAAAWRDVTLRKRREEALRASEERFRRLVEQAADAFYVADLDGRLVDANHVACESLGYATEELLDLAVWDFVEEWTSDDYFEGIAEAEQGATLSWGGVHRRKDGTIFPVETRFGLIHLQGRHNVSALARDVTERNALQEQLVRAQRMEAVGQLAGGIAHDFNNLVTAIVVYSGIAMEELSTDHPVHDYLGEIEKAADRATSLTRQLMTFSRREFGRPGAIDLRDLILDVDKMLRRLISEDIELVCRPAPDSAMVQVGPGLIEQVVVNMAVNARDAMPDGGTLAIEVANVAIDEAAESRTKWRAAGQHVRLSVSDTGVGMDKAVKSHLFEPFFTTKGSKQGTGLGLATCYGIVMQAGGEIRVESELGQGTTFEIFFPSAEEGATRRTAVRALSGLAGGSETVLLVEDEPSVRRLAAHVLREQGYTVLEASNGREALEMAHQHGTESIQLLLTDVVMPQMGGVELAVALEDFSPGISVLFTTGYTDVPLARSEGIQTGSAFMQKPFTAAQLVQTVRSSLDSRSPV